jgi:pimeloyl-ACP methyl ester carboxylesterase
VLVPGIPEWRELRVAPAVTALTIRAAVSALSERREVRPGHVGLLAFSFGATQAIMAGTDPRLVELLHGIVAWGGYADLSATFRFGLTGVHEWAGRATRMEPDPYGIWVVAGNYLTSIPGYEHAGEAAAALHQLAIEAGERGVYAWEPVYDASKARLRAALPEAQQELFDYLAPPTHRPRRDEPRAHELAGLLAAAALRCDPGLDPTDQLPHVRVPVLLAHGRDDRLIPFPESLRLHRGLPPACHRGCTITGLFAHSGGTVRDLGAHVRAREAARFLHLLHRILNLV